MFAILPLGSQPALALAVLKIRNEITTEASLRSPAAVNESILGAGTGESTCYVGEDESGGRMNRMIRVWFELLHIDRVVG